jgi:hypothetical protein
MSLVDSIEEGSHEEEFSSRSERGQRKADHRQSLGIVFVERSYVQTIEPNRNQSINEATYDKTDGITRIG